MTFSYRLIQLQRCIPKYGRRELPTILNNQYHASAAFMSTYPPHTVLTLPALSPTMETGRIGRWNKQEGEEYIAGDVICEIETDKATVDFEAQDDGYIAKILVEAGGEEKKIGEPICVSVEEEEYVGKFDGFVVEEGVDVGPLPETATLPAPVASAEKKETPLGEFVLTPSARHISVSKGLDATVLYPGSGKGGRVTKGDVLQAIDKLPQISTSQPLQPLSTAPSETAPVQPPPPAVPPPSAAPPITITPTQPTSTSYEDVPNSNMRKVIARRLTESKATVPHFYTTAAINLDPILTLRKSHNADLDTKISVNDYIVKAASLALRDVPEVNATFSPQTQLPQRSDSIDISIAVATPTGLITPIVPTCQSKSLIEINAKIKDLATRARDNKLLPEEYQGGTFTISNLGMFGIHEFSAVINPPQCAILAVGGGIPTIVPTPYREGEEEQEKPRVQTVLTVRLSADRRVVDEPTAALFLQCLDKYMSEPELMIM